MSVITESLEMTSIVVITNFVCCEYGTIFKWETAVEFNIGEVVKFIDAYEDDNVKQEHLKWRVKFQTTEGKIYSASQLNFVTTDEWDAIKTYFGKLI